MAGKTNIEWASKVWNPVLGCSPVSDGCRNCYAMMTAHKLAGNPHPKIEDAYAGLTTREGKWTGKIRLMEDRLEEPLHWRKPCRIFVNSMSDLFHEDIPFDFIVEVFAVMHECPQHDFLILTKRPERMLEVMRQLERTDNLAEAASRLRYKRTGGFGWVVEPYAWPLPNVWLGVSCENQDTADQRIPILLQCPAGVRWISAEPLLGLINLQGGTYGPDWLEGWEVEDEIEHDADGRPIALSARKIETPHLDWVVVGGESGHGARPCNVEWIRSIVRQCKAAGVACFVKQVGSVPIYESGRGETVKERADDETRQCLTWPEGTFFGNRTGLVELNGRQILLRDPKGGDPSEWPEDLRVREYPK